VDQVKPAVTDLVGDTGQAVDQAADRGQLVVVDATDAATDGVQQVGGYPVSTASGVPQGTSVQAGACVNGGVVTPLAGATAGSCTTAGN
jgi:hypothetical protein